MEAWGIMTITLGVALVLGIGIILAYQIGVADGKKMISGGVDSPVIPSILTRCSKELWEMQIGEKGYTTPWAMSITYDGRCYLNERYTIYPEISGTVSMLVERKPDGFHVDCEDVYRDFSEPYEWHRTAKPTGSWAAIKVKSVLGV